MTDPGVIVLLVLSLCAVLGGLVFVGWLGRLKVLPRAVAVARSVLYVAGALLMVWIVASVLPRQQDDSQWGIPWIVGVGVVLALLWSTRELLLDAIAGVVLFAERRIQKGMWVSGDGFQGTVEKRTIRATWLRDAQGHRLTVPNRSMIGTPVIYDSARDAEHEVVIRLEGYDRAADVRRSLQDAVLSSPWVLAGSIPVVHRDPADPVVWRVRSKLLEPRFVTHFEGELLERVEDLLRFEMERDMEERATVPHEEAMVSTETDDVAT